MKSQLSSPLKLAKLLLVCIFFSVSICASATRHVTFYTANCSATTNSITFDVYVVNDGSATVNWSYCALLFKINSSIFKSASDSCTLAYESGTSDFPLSYDSIATGHWGHKEIYIDSTETLYMYTSSIDYYWTGSTVKNMPAGSPFRIGRFTLTNNTQNFVANASVNLTWRLIGDDGAQRTHAFLYDSASNNAYNYEPYSNAGMATLTTPCSIIIPECTAPSLSASITNASCSKSTDGAVDLTVSGGTSPFTYAWAKTGDDSFSAATEDISALSAGTYTVTVTTYAGGCMATGTYTVTAPDTITTTASACSSYTWGINNTTYTSSGIYDTTISCQPYRLSLTIYGTAPDKPENINGKRFNLCNVSGEFTYTATEVPGAASYLWKASGSTDIISGNGTNIIVLNIPSDFTKGRLKVTAVNSCGKSAPRRIMLLARPAKPVIAGPACVSANETGRIYTVVNAFHDVTYTWTVPGFAKITSGQGTRTVTVDWGQSSGVIQCTPSNNCAEGIQVSYNVTVGCASAAAKAVKNIQLQAYPNPSQGLITVIFSSEKEADYKLAITDITGRQIMSKKITAAAGSNKLNIDISKYANGIYMLSLISDKGVQTVKLVKQ